MPHNIGYLNNDDATSRSILIDVNDDEIRPVRLETEHHSGTGTENGAVANGELSSPGGHCHQLEGWMEAEDCEMPSIAVIDVEQQKESAAASFSHSHSHSESHNENENDHEGHGHSHNGHGHAHNGHSHNHEEHDHELGEEDEDSQKKITSKKSERVLWMVAALSAIFICAEFTGGFFASSLAIMTDAGHMLSDLLSFIISIVAIRTARQPASKRLSFGYERAEVLGALVSIVILWVLTAVLVFLAIMRIINNNYEVDANPMLITASAGVAFNIIMGLVLHFGSAGHAHSHGGGHGHSHGGNNVNVRAAFIHVIGDLIQSVGVLIAAIVIKFTDWGLADPICTFFFSIIVLFTTITVIRDIFMVLMEATPRHINYSSVKDDLAALDGVLGVHDLRVWSLNMDKAALDVHLAIDDESKTFLVTSAARSLAKQKYGVSVATVQVERYDKSMTSCGKCTNN